MDDPREAFRNAVGRLADQWLTAGLPSHQEMEREAKRLGQLRDQLNVLGLWEHPPTMLTATLDDGLGQGLAIIENFAAMIGLNLVALGLMQAPDAIIDACSHYQPDYLGLTILQFDSEDDLKTIAAHLPTRTTIVAGGPVYSGDADFARRTGTHYAAKNVADFLGFMVRTSG